MLKVTIILTHIREQANTPPSNSLLDDYVVEAMSLVDKTLLKVVDTVDFGTVDSSLQNALGFIVDQIKVWALGWP